MAKQIFAVLYEEDPLDITQEARIQTALFDAMRQLDIPFTIVPPDIVGPKLSERAARSADN